MRPQRRTRHKPDGGKQMDIDVPDAAPDDHGEHVHQRLPRLDLPEAARGLIEPAVVASGEAGSRFQLTIEVDDVDAICAELASRGVELLNGPMDRPWGIRTASFKDPGGHIWEIAR